MSEQIPVLQEHQAPESNPTEPDTYQPSPEERQTIKMVNRHFEKAKQCRKNFDQDWHKRYKYFRGKQWTEARPSYRHSEVVNFIFQTIQSQVPVLADARQRFEFVAQEPSDTEFAKILDEVAESDWQAGNWTYKLTEGLYDGHIYGTALYEMGFDPKAMLGRGRITFGTKDVFYFFPDAEAKDCNEKCRYIVIAEPEDLETIKRDYPENGKHVKADLIDLLQGNKHELDQIRFKSPVDNRSTIEGTSVYDQQFRDQALKLTLFIFDNDFDEERKEEQDPETGEIKEKFIQKLKYPNGRKICVAGGVLLSDGPMDLDEKLMPFARFVNYMDPRMFWGISEEEQLEGPQNIFNKVYSFVLDVLTLMGNPIWVVDNDSEVDTDNLYNRPGLVVEKAKGTEVRREEGTQLQPYVLNILDRVREYIDSISGSNDVTRGVRPEGITAASAISSLQEAAQTRSRQKSRNLDATLQNLGQLYKAYALQYYDAPRVFRLTNQDGSQKYFKFHVETIENPDGTTSKKARIRDYKQDPETGAYAESINEREYLIRGDFDVRVVTGSNLPFAKDQKFAKARQMFLDGVIDDEEYLKQSEYPNWQNVLQRVQQKKMQAAQAEAAAKGAPPPGGPPPAA